MHDAVDLRGREAGAARELHDDGCRRATVRRRPVGMVGECQVDARRVDAAELRDRPCELALERTLVAQPLHEVGLTRRLSVEELEADAAARGQAAARERHAEPVEAVARHEQRAAVVVDTVRHALGREPLTDRRSVAGVEVREERSVDRGLDAPGDGDHERERRQGRTHHGEPAPRRQGGEERGRVRPHGAQSHHDVRRSRVHPSARSGVAGTFCLPGRKFHSAGRPVRRLAVRVAAPVNSLARPPDRARPGSGTRPACCAGSGC